MIASRMRPSRKAMMDSADGATSAKRNEEASGEDVAAISQCNVCEAGFQALCAAARLGREGLLAVAFDGAHQHRLDAVLIAYGHGGSSRDRARA